MDAACPHEMFIKCMIGHIFASLRHFAGSWLQVARMLGVLHKGALSRKVYARGWLLPSASASACRTQSAAGPCLVDPILLFHMRPPQRLSERGHQSRRGASRLNGSEG